MLSSAFVKESSRAARFLLSGGSATLVHWASMGSMVALGTNASVATATGAAVGAMVNYALQRRFTFHSTARHRDLVPLYVGAVLLGWVVNLLVFSVLDNGMRIPVALSQVMTSLFVAFLNFWVFKRIVFS